MICKMYPWSKQLGNAFCVVLQWFICWYFNELLNCLPTFERKERMTKIYFLSSFDTRIGRIISLHCANLRFLGHCSLILFPQTRPKQNNHTIRENTSVLTFLLLYLSDRWCLHATSEWCGPWHLRARRWEAANSCFGSDDCPTEPCTLSGYSVSSNTNKQG